MGFDEDKALGPFVKDRAPAVSRIDPQVADVKGDTSAAEPAFEADDEGDLWVSLREASERVGVSMSALRKWREAGDIPWRIEPGPTGQRVVVPLAAVEDRARRTRSSDPRAE